MSEEIAKHEKLHLIIYEPESTPKLSLGDFEGFPKLISEFSKRATKIVLSNPYSESIVFDGNHTAKSLPRGDDIPYIYYTLRVFDEDIAQNTGISFEIQSSTHMDSMHSWKHETISIALDGSKILLETLVDDSTDTWMHFFNSPFNIKTPINEIKRDHVTANDIIFLNVVLGNYE